MAASSLDVDTFRQVSSAGGKHGQHDLLLPDPLLAHAVMITMSTVGLKLGWSRLLFCIGGLSKFNIVVHARMIPSPVSL